MTPKERFELHKDDGLYNTSYPLTPEDWALYRHSKPLSFEDEKGLSFYIHIPFCKSLCNFCEYIKYPIPSESIQLQYLDILQRDIDNFVESLPKDPQGGPKAVLRGFDIGGGTPTALSPKALEKLLLIMGSNVRKFNVGNDFVGSIEGSFSTIDSEKISIIGSTAPGIGRISFGIQNINPAWLRNQNRASSPIKHIVSTVDQCRKCGIGIINLDLMYGFYGQSRDSFDATLELVGQIRPEHLTVYELRTNMLKDKRCASPQKRFDQYLYLYEKITAMGYIGRFGCNTFSLIGDDGVSSYLRSRMIPGGAYKGFGISAQSKSQYCISYNIGKRNLPLEQCLEQGTFESGGDVYLLPPKELAAKYIAICGYCGQFSLSKLNSFWKAKNTSAVTSEKGKHIAYDSASLFKDENSENIRMGWLEKSSDYFTEEINFLVECGYLEIDGDIATITPKGFRYYGAVLSMFYPEKN